jgi:hypothetical protein
MKPRKMFQYSMCHESMRKIDRQIKCSYHSKFHSINKTSQEGDKPLDQDPVP